MTNTYQYNVTEGDVVKYKGKEYVIVSVDIEVNALCMRVFMVRTGGYNNLRWAKEVWDDEVNKLEPVRIWKKIILDK